VTDPFQEPEDATALTVEERHDMDPLLTFARS